MDDVIKLLNVTTRKDAYGIDRKAYTSREVFCNVKSVSRAEFHAAGRNGLNPDFEITMFAADYEGETVVEYEGNTFAVYRTYRADGDYIELYVERQGGTNGIEAD